MARKRLNIEDSVAPTRSTARQKSAEGDDRTPCRVEEFIPRGMSNNFDDDGTEERALRITQNEMERKLVENTKLQPRGVRKPVGMIEMECSKCHNVFEVSAVGVSSDCISWKCDRCCKPSGRRR